MEINIMYIYLFLVVTAIVMVFGGLFIYAKGRRAGFKEGRENMEKEAEEKGFGNVYIISTPTKKNESKFVWKRS